MTRSLVTPVLSRTGEKVDSIGSDALRCTQCPAGKPKNARNCSWSPVILATALEYLALDAVGGVLDRFLRVLTVADVADLRERLAGRDGGSFRWYRRAVPLQTMKGRVWAVSGALVRDDRVYLELHQPFWIDEADTSMKVQAGRT